MTATQAKAQILALLDDVAAGNEIEITKHGRTVARLVPRQARPVCGVTSPESSAVSQTMSSCSP